ncbi:MAG: hypothetical protein KKE73_09800 [Proteobacteria bacterium]|nr:hypothetical protein [Pseudomonadota bacterium]
MEELFRIIKEGPANDIWMVTQADELFFKTFAHTEELGGDLFPLIFAVRQHAQAMAILLTCRIYEPPKKDYQILGLPLAYQYILDNAETLTPANPDLLARLTGHDCRPISPGMLGDGEWEKMSEEEIKAYYDQERQGIIQMVRTFGEQGLEAIPQPKVIEGDDLSTYLEHVKRWRDKHVAHNEMIPEMDGLFLNMRRLISHARSLVTNLCDAFFGYKTKPYGGVMPTDGADQAAEALGRLAQRLKG